MTGETPNYGNSAPRNLVIIGAGGFGRETLDVVEAINAHAPDAVFNVLGVIDDAPSEQNMLLLGQRSYKWLGTISENENLLESAEIAIAVGSPKSRRAIRGLLPADLAQFPALLHPSATIGSRPIIRPGVIVCADVTISTNVELQEFCHVNPAATIGHDACLQQFVSVNPAAVISGKVVVEEASLIGANATVLQNLTIGAEATVAASACVTKHVPRGVTAVGVPARWD